MHFQKQMLPMTLNTPKYSISSKQSMYSSSKYGHADPFIKIENPVIKRKSNRIFDEEISCNWGLKVSPQKLNSKFSKGTLNFPISSFGGLGKVYSICCISII